MTSKIFYPFDIQHIDYERYSYTVDFARQTNSEVTFFTVLPENSSEQENNIPHLYLSRHYGYYQSFHNRWQRMDDFKKKRVFKEGALRLELKKILQTEQYDLLIPNSSECEQIINEFYTKAHIISHSLTTQLFNFIIKDSIIK
ncbi:hypothetical protein [Gelidibacter salicanalis]|uniref:Uncharacterized protein n=1 Tax=Gelidibacter salicanalis TaxID=291193 RepID=A0A934KTZ6_9FLAO|nr:hypothetical protein [Gelidibacter salicanalis]MBJ7880713.1 hypothetical protein [Gelidibacter salicanalis]